MHLNPWLRHSLRPVNFASCLSVGLEHRMSVPRFNLTRIHIVFAHFFTRLSFSSYTTKKTGFATLVILLPSCYTGGQVQVSHDGSTRTFDFAAHSAADICMFAWYNEASLAVDPIAAGYQLALVYDVILTSSAFPRLPDLQPAISELRKVLQKWSEGHYTDDSGSNLVAIRLDPQVRWRFGLENAQRRRSSQGVPYLCRGSRNGIRRRSRAVDISESWHRMWRCGQVYV